MAVTVEEIKGLGAGEKLALGESTYARGNADGSVSFTLRRKIGEKSVDTTLGRFEAITKAVLREVRDAALAARKEAPKPRAKAASTPGKLNSASTMREVWEHRLAGIDSSPGFWSAQNRRANLSRIDAHCSQWPTWERSIAEVKVDDLMPALMALRSKTPDQLKKVCGLLRGMFTHAQVHGVMAEGTDPMPLIEKRLRHDYKAPATKHYSAILEIEKLRELVKAIRHMSGDGAIRNALFLQAMTAQRTGEVIGAQWSEFDLDAEVPTWTIPRSRMKISLPERGDHVLHLSRQCVAWLRTLQTESAFLFPGRKGNDTITSEGISKGMRTTLKQEGVMVPHGWRSSLSTLARRAADADGRPMFADSWAESLLDHLSGNAVEDAYQRGGHHAGAGRILQWWSDQLLG